MKVLIIDDSEPMRRMIRRFISDQVDEFVECEDGSEALAAYRRHRPDLVLMDIRMKDVDGLEATRELRRSFPEARVVVVSQWDGPDVREKVRGAGAYRYIHKSDLLPLRELLASAGS